MTGDRGAGSDNHGYQVPRLLRAAEVLCADGRVLRGRVFLPAAAESHPGAMRAEEWMNDPAVFFPFLPDGEGSPVILNKEQVLVVTVSAAADRDDTMDEVPAPVRRVNVECGALRLQGEVVIDRDEQPAKATPDKIPTLRPAFRKDGTVTAANSSSISDGAAALVLMRRSTAECRSSTSWPRSSGSLSSREDRRSSRLGFAGSSMGGGR